MARDVEKQRANWRKWYHANKAAAANARQKVQERLYAWYLEYKTKQKCSKCGFDKHPAALTFHHVDPTTKLGNIADMARRGTRKKLLAEIDKCIILCANCHAILEDENRTVV